MSFKYVKLLASNNIATGDLSRKLQKKVNDLEKLNGAIPRMEQQMKAGNLSVSKKEETTTKIAEAKEALPVLDQELVEAINEWLPNREKYAAQGQRLQNARTAKAQGSAPAAPAIQSTPAAAATAQAAPEPAKGGTAAYTTKATNGSAAPAKQSDSKLKDNSLWGWIGLGLLTVIGTVIGVNVYKTYQKK